jgi:hypothetical protein
MVGTDRRAVRRTSQNGRAPTSEARRQKTAIRSDGLWARVSSRAKKLRYPVLLAAGDSCLYSFCARRIESPSRNFLIDYETTDNGVQSLV